MLLVSDRRELGNDYLDTPYFFSVFPVGASIASYCFAGLAVGIITCVT